MVAPTRRWRSRLAARPPPAARPLAQTRSMLMPMIATPFSASRPSTGSAPSDIKILASPFRGVDMHRLRSSAACTTKDAAHPLARFLSVCNEKGDVNVSGAGVSSAASGGRLIDGVW
eukprot:6204731-Pleurochrysis_carterae.AAC.4